MIYTPHDKRHEIAKGAAALTLIIPLMQAAPLINTLFSLERLLIHEL